MTYSAVPALRATPEVAAAWEPRITSTTYDGTLRPGRSPARSSGWRMTEKQGGSDVRANTTAAAADADGGWRLDGPQVVLLARR